MKTFKKYADYYDLFYKEKNYKKECEFLEKVFRKYSKEPIRSVLDLGCGTGGHALILNKRGYEVTGIDLSSEMIKIAKKKSKEKKIKVNFINRDIRKINFKRKFDAVISMFAVLGYLTDKKDLELTFKKIGEHLNTGGILIFDCWWGPTVLKIKPETRIKIFKENKKKIIRIVTPLLNKKKQTVRVEYEIIRLFKKNIVDDFKEIHKLRYFLYKEIQNYLKMGNLKLLKISPFMKIDKKVTTDDWNVTVIAKKL